ncbi:MAG: glycosyltransferase family 9 protein [Candidatus Accumulibacter sp.]|nr:glycosyltransferase family 9 protein [Accumulibacter sp.]
MKLQKTLKPGLRFIASILLHVFDSAVLLNRNARGRSAVIVRTDAIGDFILWLPYAKKFCGELRSRNERIVFVCNSVWADFARSELPVEIFPVERSRFRSNLSYRFRILRSLARIGADRVYHPVLSRDSIVGDSIVHACGGYAYGFSGNAGNQSRAEEWLGNRSYSALLPAGAPLRHETAYHEMFLTWILKTAWAPEEKISFPARKKTGAAYWVLVPGAGKKERRWPLDSFSRLIEKISRDFPDLRLKLLGSAPERNLCQKLLDASKIETENLAGQTSLAQMFEIIASASFFIGNESSGGHMAALLQVPSVCIVGGGHFGRFMPYTPERHVTRKPPAVASSEMACYGCNWQCRFSPDPSGSAPCVARITVEEVHSALGRTLSITDTTP